MLPILSYSSLSATVFGVENIKEHYTLTCVSTLSNRKPANELAPVTHGVGPSLKRSPVTGSKFKSPCACEIRNHSRAKSSQHSAKLSANILITYLHWASILKLFRQKKNVLMLIRSLYPSTLENNPHQSSDKILKKPPRSIRNIEESHIPLPGLIDNPFRPATSNALEMGIPAMAEALHALETLQFNGQCNLIVRPSKRNRITC